MTGQAWWLPGFAVEALIGFGASGEVWRARDEATGEVVALKRLHRDSTGAADGERLRREAALLAEVAAPHVLRLRGVVVTDDDTVLVLDHAAGGSLAALLGVRQTLDAAEVVTVLAPLAATLADLHARGLVHGDLSPGNVLFTADGKPLLADLGVARLVGEPATRPAEGTAGFLDPVVACGAVPGPASDVHALAAIGYAALSGRPPWDAPTPAGAVALAAAGNRPPLREAAPSAPAALVEVIEAGLAADPARRPTAAAFAAAVRQAAAAAPVRLVRGSPVADGERTHRVGPPAAPVPVQAQPRRRPGRRPWLKVPRPVVVGACVVLALGLAAAAGSAWGRAERPHAQRLTAAPAPAPASAAPVVWRQVVGRLVADRAAALSARRVGGLSEVYAPGAQQGTADAATVRTLLASGLRVAAPLRPSVADVRVESVTAGRVRLRVRDSLAAYDVVDATGHVVRHDPGRSPAWWDVVLVPVGSGWRIASITAAA